MKSPRYAQFPGLATGEKPPVGVLPMDRSYLIENKRIFSIDTWNPAPRLAFRAIPQSECGANHQQNYPQPDRPPGKSPFAKAS
jgi:hypothetical protein